MNKHKQWSAVFILTIGVILINKYVDSDKDNKKEKTKEVVKKEEKKETKVVGKAPEIKLNGPSEVKIVKNGILDDLGATAKDEEHGDLSKNVKIDSKVDYSKPGTYEIVYSVKDKDNNVVNIYILKKILQVMKFIILIIQ